VGPASGLDMVAERKLPPPNCSLLKIVTELSLVLKQIQV
jgi:hypothetical protein